jgi:Gluconate 2-dehydrogenase subunit 3
MPALPLPSMGDEPPKSVALTRRQWLLRLGEATALLGFSGELSRAWAEALDSAKASALPPGLYEPSMEHFAHALSSDGPFHYLPPGSETDYVRPPTGPYRPLFFTPAEFATVRRIAELLLGESAAKASAAKPNAEDLGQTLAEWIDLSVSSAAGIRRAARALKPEHRELAVAVEGEDSIRRLEEREPERICREGLAWLDRTSKAKFQHPFMALAAGQQIDLLRQISDGKRAADDLNPGQRFFDLLKREVIRGFYTSRAGLQELEYKGNSFYGESPGCDSQA